jgi:hypothetical protein
MQGKSGFSKRREYPYQVSGLANLPVGLRQLAEQAQPPAEPANAIFVIPGQMLSKEFGGFGGVHWVPEQALLFTPHGVFHVQAGKSTNEMGQVKYLPGNSLLYARVSLIILYGRMELCGVVNDNLTSIVVVYNSVSHELMEPALKNFLHLAWDQTRDEGANYTNDFLLGKLNEQSYKFRSGLEYHSLSPNERLQGFVFQPSIYKHYLHIFHRLIAPAGLIALTDKQLIIIEEGVSSATSYGYFFTFCPKANVVNVVTKTKGRLQDVYFHLRKDNVTADHQLTLENANALACQTLWAKYA